MKQLISFALALSLVLPLSSMAYQFDNGDVYFQGTYHQAINKAQLQGKLMILEFSADWCIPCQWMKKTTFKDPTLVDYLNRNTVTLDVNIDDFDGFELKQQYDVQFLPTIIILNTEGDILAKIEQSLGAEKLRKIIEGHYTTSNTKKIDVDPIATPEPIKEVFVPEIADQKVINIDQTPIHKNNSDNVIQKEEYNKAPQTEELYKVVDTEVVETEDVQKSNNISTKYVLQIGAFNTLSNAQEVGSMSTSVFQDHPIIVQFENGVYKVISTQFHSRKDAENLMALLSNQYDIKSFIRTE